MKNLNEIKKKADKSIAERVVKRDEDGNAIINMTVADDSYFLSPFAISDKPVIDNEVANFLENRTKGFLPKEQFTLNVYSDCIDDGEKKIYSKAIKEYFSEHYVANEREVERNVILSFILAVVGIAVLVLMIALENFFGVIWTEVLDIVAWVFLWEAVYLYFFHNRSLKLKRYRYLALMSMNIRFYSQKEYKSDQNGSI